MAEHPPYADAAVRDALYEDEEHIYPCSDGQPMADDTWQAEAMMAAALELGAALPAAFVAAKLFVYFEQGKPDSRIAPDVMVAFGVGRRHRMNYRIWGEGKPPDWVLEVASHKTNPKDRERRRAIYQAVGVPEYWLFDPMGIFPPGMPRLQGFVLGSRDYRLIEPGSGGGRTQLRSAVLGLDLAAEGDLIRFRYPASGRAIEHPIEAAARFRRRQASP